MSMNIFKKEMEEQTMNKITMSELRAFISWYIPRYLLPAFIVCGAYLLLTPTVEHSVNTDNIRRIQTADGVRTELLTNKGWGVATTDTAKFCTKNNLYTVVEPISEKSGQEVIVKCSTQESAERMTFVSWVLFSTFLSMAFLLLHVYAVIIAESFSLLSMESPF